MLHRFFFVFLRSISFGEGEGAGIHYCSGWFIGGDIRGMHLCWVCVKGWSVNHTDQVDPYVDIKLRADQGYGSS